PPPNDLHSSPTRRSSDLPPPAPRHTASIAQTPTALPPLLPSAHPQPPPTTTQPRRPPSPTGTGSSRQTPTAAAPPAAPIPAPAQIGRASWEGKRGDRGRR